MTVSQKTKSFFKRTLLIFKPFWKYIGLFIGLMFIGQIIGAISPYIFGKGVDAVIGGDAKKTIEYMAIAFLLFYFQQQILARIRDHIEIKKMDRNIEMYFSKMTLNKILSFSIGQHINEHSGVNQQIVNKGQNAIENIMYNGLFSVLPGLLEAVATLIILAFFDWRISFCAAVFVGLYIYVTSLSNKENFPKIEAVRKREQVITKLQSEFFRNASVVISEAKESDVQKRFSDKADDMLSFANGFWLNYNKDFFARKNLLTFGRWVTLGLGTYLIFMGFHSVGMLVTMFAWVGTIFSGIVDVMNILRHMLFKIAETKKLYEILDMAPDMDVNTGSTVLKEVKGKVQFRNVHFAYPYRKSAKEEEEDTKIDGSKKDENHAVEDINFIIPAGGKIGFVGISGSGKSTIVNLIRRYYDPTQGEIIIDGAPLKQIDLRWFRSQIGNVEQKIELFDRSIRENILFGLPDSGVVSDEQIMKAVEDASLAEFVEQLKEHGLDTVIGEGGIKVSGGERQRIGIARALIKNPKF